MKRRTIVPGVAAIALMGGLLLWKPVLGTRPFQALTPDAIEQVTVKLLPPDVELTLTDENIEQFVPILQEATTYRMDNAYGNYEGQAVIFTITRKNGTQTTVNAYNPFLVIDGVGYRTRYKPCHALSSFAIGLRT